MGKITIGIEDDEARFESERGFEPAIGGLCILITNGA
jgi:hypothetical protein